jgi:hypothetical protein
MASATSWNGDILTGDVVLVVPATPPLEHASRSAFARSKCRRPLLFFRGWRLPHGTKAVFVVRRFTAKPSGFSTGPLAPPPPPPPSMIKKHFRVLVLRSVVVVVVVLVVVVALNSIYIYLFGKKMMT